MAKTRTRRDDRPAIILDAAERVIRRLGTRALTIDAVATEAALSKGGVLHHYASKEALVTALAERKIAHIRERLVKLEAEQPPGPQAAAAALVAQVREVYADEDGFPRALLLASADNPEATAGFNALLTEQMAKLEAVAASPGAGALLNFAAMGLLLTRTLGFHRLEGAELETVFAALADASRKLPGA